MRTDFLASLGPIVAAPWQQRRNQDGTWSVVLFVALCACGPAALFVWSLFQSGELAENMRQTAGQCAVASTCVLALAWWAVLVSSVLQQNRPTFARLVPQHPARLRAALLLPWVALSVAATLLLVAVFPAGHIDPLATLAESGALLAFIGVLVRWPMLGVLGCFAPLVVGHGPAAPSLARALAALHGLWAMQAPSIAATVLAAAAVLLVALIQHGDPRHTAAYEARLQRQRRFQARARGERPVDAGSRRCFNALLARPYDGWLNRLLARSDSSVGARLLAGLGPSVHWTGVLTATVFMAAAIPVLVSMLELVGVVSPVIRGALPLVAGSIALGAMFSLVAPVTQTRARLHQTRREQSVLALLPGVPRGAALGRWLSLRMAVQALLAWVGAVAITASLVLLALHLPGDPLDRGLIDFYVDFPRYIALGSLSLIALQWPRWARVSAPTSLSALAPTLGSIAVAALVYFCDRMGWITFTQATVVVPLAVFAWCALRWWRMGREPSAFPVGRLAR